MKHFTNTLSSAFGFLASCRFPKPIQTFINKMYVKFMKVNLDGFPPVQSYSSLLELFTRAPNTPLQNFLSSNEIGSPSDGLIIETGDIAMGRVYQIKNTQYNISPMLGNYVTTYNKERLNGGSFATIYLSPKDYHRYHAPCDLKIRKAIHIPAKLYPVNFRYLNKKEALYAQNERVVLECESNSGVLFYMIFVGAYNVGKMKFNFDSRIQTNAKMYIETFYTYNDMFIKQAEELGQFEMGSTIVLLFEKDGAELDLKPLQKVFCTKKIGIFKN